MALNDPVKRKIVLQRVLNKLICRKCGAINSPRAEKCRRCGSRNLRPKKAELRGKGA
ncbi:MAG: 50S ribosomal protein L40e [Desulfurococcaceae archaeon]